MLTIQDYIPVTKAKSAFLDIIRKIEGSDDAIAITKNGVPEAVLLSMSKFEGLMETMEILSDEKAIKSLDPDSYLLSSSNLGSNFPF